MHLPSIYRERNSQVRERTRGEQIDVLGHFRVDLERFLSLLRFAARRENLQTRWDWFERKDAPLDGRTRRTRRDIRKMDHRYDRVPAHRCEHARIKAHRMDVQQRSAKRRLLARVRRANRLENGRGMVRVSLIRLRPGV